MLETSKKLETETYLHSETEMANKQIFVVTKFQVKNLDLLDQNS